MDTGFSAPPASQNLRIRVARLSTTSHCVSASVRPSCPWRAPERTALFFALTHSELDLLYAAPGLEAYRAEAIVAQAHGGMPTPALCYNLRDPPLADEWNPGYASRLQEVLQASTFPGVRCLCFEARGLILRPTRRARFTASIGRLP